jgi:hypothetical protein
MIGQIPVAGDVISVFLLFWLVNYTWLMTSYPCDGHIQTAGRGGKKKGGGASPSAGHCQGSADGGELISFFSKKR